MAHKKVSTCCPPQPRPVRNMPPLKADLHLRKYFQDKNFKPIKFVFQSEKNLKVEIFQLFLLFPMESFLSLEIFPRVEISLNKPLRYYHIKISLVVVF